MVFVHYIALRQGKIEHSTINNSLSFKYYENSAKSVKTYRNKGNEIYKNRPWYRKVEEGNDE